MRSSSEQPVTVDNAPANLHAGKYLAVFPHVLPAPFKHAFLFREELKLLLRAVRGYELYYLAQAGVLCAYCIIKHQYLHKYGFMSASDRLINPYYVVPGMRGNGYGGYLIRAAIADKSTDWTSLWAVVKEDNTASIKTLQKLGFQLAGYSKKGVWTHHLTRQRTPLLVFCFQRDLKKGTQQ